MHPLDKIATNWTDEENNFFENQSDSKDIFQLELTGNKRTGDQIKDWKPPSVQAMEDRFKDWDGKSELNFELPEGGEIKKFHGPGSAQAGAFIETMTVPGAPHGMAFHPTTGELFIAQFAYDDDLEVFDFAAGSQSPKYNIALDGGKDVQFVGCSS